MNGAEILVESLYEQGVRHVFGMPGSHVVGIYDALARHGRIQTILARNEQAAAFMADGYARSSGRPGVVCTTAGPGATNALTGIAEAWADSVPVLLLAGQVNRDRLGKETGNYHEMDLESIFRPCTRYCNTVLESRHIAEAVERAFREMSRGRRRPAALFLPQDLMAAPAEPRSPSPVERWMPPCPDAAKIAETAQLLAKSRRPLILAGSGAVWSGARILALARKLSCPVVATQSGKGLVDDRDPHSLGHARSIKGRIAWIQADTLLAVGCRFTEVFTDFRRLRPPATLIQIDIEPEEIGLNYPVTVGLAGDADDVLDRLLQALPDRVAGDWSDIRRSIDAVVHPQPEWLIDILREELPHESPLVADACEMGYRMHLDYPTYRPRTFLYPSSYIALGWGFPAAVGAAVALPDRPVVSFSGDGGFVMTMQELATAARYRLHVIAIVHNDSAYGAIRHMQRLRYGQGYIDSDLNNPDFVKLAEAFGIPAERAATPEAFRAALRRAVKRAGPSFIEVPDEWRYLRLPHS